MVLELIEDQSSDIQTYYRKGHALSDRTKSEIHDGVDPLQLKNFIKKKARKYFESEPDTLNLFITPVFKNLNTVFEFKEYLLSSFQNISLVKKPWQTALFIEYGSDGYNLPSEIVKSLFQMELSYGKIHTTIVQDEVERTLVKRKLFIVDGYYVEKTDIENDPGLIVPSNFLWGTAASRVFFDFLFLGGQEYFLFCEHCGKFTVVKRKGRKKYCSDICRTAAQRK